MFITVCLSLKDPHRCDKLLIESQRKSIKTTIQWNLSIVYHTRSSTSFWYQMLKHRNKKTITKHYLINSCQYLLNFDVIRAIKSVPQNQCLWNGIYLLPLCKLHLKCDVYPLSNLHFLLSHFRNKWLRASLNTWCA